jgi:hypothetical protein
MKFGLIYNKNTNQIECMIVPSNKKENIIGSIILFPYQRVELFNIKYFDIDINKMQELLNKRLKQWQ